MQSAQHILSVDHLSISFRHRDSRQVAVKSISFTLKKGRTLAVVGESGSGKSVSALAIMKLLPATASIDGGTIIYENDQDLSQLSEQKIIRYRGAKIGMIFQEPMSSLNPSQRCGYQIAEMLEIHTKLDKKSIKEKVLYMLSQVDFDDPERVYTSYPHQLSGGQLQRVMIAMVLVCEPDILIADEPTTALDVTIQDTIVGLLDEFKQKLGLSTIFITHDLGLVKRIADDVVVMHKGKIVDRGTVDTIFRHPKEQYTKGLMACRPPIDVRYRKMPVVEDFLYTNKNVDEVIQAFIQPQSEYLTRLEKINRAPVLLKAEGIKKYYVKSKSIWGKPRSYVHAVEDVSFLLRKGETLGLVGESGCGKTTLSKVLMRLIEPTAGNIVFDGKDILNLNDRKMRQLRKDYQIIFQDPYGSLNPRMKIGTAISEPMETHNIGVGKKERKERTIQLLERVGMQADHYDRYPHQFSGGQRQRICIARALATRPKFILCDEIVSALDVSVQAQVLNLLVELREEYELSYIFISHDLSVVKFISDHILVMKDGRVVERGDAESIIHRPQHVYTQQLVDAVLR